MSTFFMAGGGTGGHVIPALAVARELAARGHQPVFIGTRTGFEATLVPRAGFSIEWIRIGGLKNSGFLRAARSLFELPWSVVRCLGLIAKHRPAAVFSMGGYVAGPVVLAALARRLPVIVMEPNAMPGAANRWIGRFVARALLSFPEAARFFPRGRVEVTGLPVRPEFFQIQPRASSGVRTILITGGSRGARTLNRAARESWPLWKASACKIRLIHQTGAQAHPDTARAFAETGLDGEVVPFIEDMPSAFAQAGLIVCRSGAGAVAELTAAGKPSILVPFPYAADNHQFHNADALARAGAARLVPDRELTGQRLHTEIAALLDDPGELERMGERARALAHPDAAQRAADWIEQLGRTGA